MSSSDRVMRAMTIDGAFRVITVNATETVQQIVELQGASGSDVVRFGELLTAAILLRETMSPGNRVQAALSGLGGGRLLADSWPDGDTRGLYTSPDSGQKLEIGEGSLLQTSRVMHRGRIHQSITEIPESGDISEAFMRYFQNSEQIATTIDLGCQVEAGRVRSCGGYLVQLLPEVTPDPLRRLTARLDGLPAATDLLSADPTPAALIARLLEGFEHQALGESPVQFECPCSPVRVLGAMATLGKTELEDIIATGEVLDVDCDYCGKHYDIGAEALRTLLDRN